MGTLFFRESRTEIRQIEFCGEKGIRVDRVLQCEINGSESQLRQKVRLASKYKMLGDGRTYRTEYRYDLIPKNSNRVTWLHQDSTNGETYTQPIQQQCVGDIITISMSLLNL